MSNESGSVGTIDAALANAEQLLERQPDLALEQVGELLKAVPSHPRARLVLGAARRLLGQTQFALEVLEPLAREYPDSAAALLELAIARGQAGDSARAISALNRALELKPDWADAWRLLADLHDAGGQSDRADVARAHYLRAATRVPRLQQAATALVANDLPLAERLLRSHLQQHSTDVAALRMLAEVAARLRRYLDAQRLLERCLELAPSFEGARHNYAMVLNRQGKAAAALPQVERLLATQPRNPGYRNLQAAILANLGDYAQSIQVYEAALREFPRQPKVWMSYGHSLKTAGRQADSIAAYQRAIAAAPTLGEAWWSLANLKTFRFSDADLAALRAALQRADLADEDRLHFEFALGKALEDRARYPESFAHYAAGNALRRRLHPYSAADNTQFVQRAQALFSADFFAARAGDGAAAPDPIFILGLPRSGSTLLEQILASHSLIEGTMELADVPQIAHELVAGSDSGDGQGFAQAVATLQPEQLRALGQRYLDSTRSHRKTEAPFFIDKMPNNCLYIGLIHLMLPNARIIDARRHPMGCCFSCFKQHFARGQNFAYDLNDLGRYYRDYVRLMQHFDAVLPGRVHRVLYEALIEDTEAEVRRLLQYCGLAFEPQCLKFYQNERAVRTASSEQVRQPIFREGLDQWRHFEPWLDPLKQALGSALQAYPAVPDSFDN